MAQLPRTYPVGGPSSASAVSRLPANSRSVAAAQGQAVEGSSPGVGATFDDGAFSFQEYGQSSTGGRQARRQSGGLVFNTPSQSFASLFQSDEGGDEGRGRDVISLPGSRGFVKAMSKAIATYENNAKVIDGTSRMRGNALSLSL